MHINPIRELAEAIRATDMFSKIPIEEKARAVLIYMALVGVVYARAKSTMHALLFLRKVLERRANRPTFVVGRGPCYGWAFRSLGLTTTAGSSSVNLSIIDRSKFGRILLRIVSARCSSQIWRRTPLAIILYASTSPSGTRRGHWEL